MGGTVWCRPLFSAYHIIPSLHHIKENQIKHLKPFLSIKDFLTKKIMKKIDEEEEKLNLIN